MPTDWYGNPYTPSTRTGSDAGIGYGADPATLATKTAQANLAASPYNVQLADIINRVNREAQKQANLARIPGAAGLEEQSSENIQDLLSGRLSSSYLENLYTNLAQQWGGRGYGVDTPALNAAALRAIGITTEDLQKRGQEQLTAAYARNPAAPLFDISSMLTTPSVYSTTAANRAALAERARESDAELAYKYAALARSLGGGGGGGGAPRLERYAPGTTSAGGYQPNTIYYSPGYGTLTTPSPTVPESWDERMTGSGAVTPYTPEELGWSGARYPTESGFMAMGTPEDVGYSQWLAEVGLE